MGSVKEAFVGEFASGKSEVAINRAIHLKDTRQNEVTLVDLDLVNPFYTLRPIKKLIEDKGIFVISWERRRGLLGQGEASILLKPEMRWALKRKGDVILDIGYGPYGARIFNLIEDAYTDPNFKIYMIVNISKPLTSTVDDIVEYVKSFGRVDGLINNSHLGDYTTPDVIEEGIEKVKKASFILKIPVVATVVEEKLKKEFENRTLDHPVWFIKRYMKEAFW